MGIELLKQPVDGVFFTGSYATGKRIAEAVAGRMIKLQIELGGKDPTYVCDDVDVAAAAASLADGAMYNTGQSCCSVERIYVHEKIHDAFADAFVEEVKGFKVGEPTVLVNVNHDMAVMREESFGPIIGIQKVASDDEAVRLMNDTDYGLTAGVYTKNEARAKAILAQVQAGSVYCNCCDRVSPRLPWGGVKHSGVGLTLSTYGIETFTRPKAWHLRAPA